MNDDFHYLIGVIIGCPIGLFVYWLFIRFIYNKKFTSKQSESGAIKVLLAQRSDGKFLRLNEEDHNATSYDFVDEPEFAKHIIPLDESDLKKPYSCSYYFENSFRAREYWLRNCKMVAYEITTTAKPL